MYENKSIESWKNSIGKIEMDLFETAYAYIIVQPKVLILTTNGTLQFSIEETDLISETISVISVIVSSIKRIIELNLSEDIVPSFMDYDYGDLHSLIVTLKTTIRHKLDEQLKTKIIGVFITEEGEYVYTTYKNPSWFYDVNTGRYVGRLVEVNGVYEAILTHNNKTIEFKSIM